MVWAIALHAGADDMLKDLPAARKEAVEACLSHCLRLGASALESAHTALDVTKLVVKELEANQVFNTGRGSVLTSNGTVEMEACIMDRPTMNCGAVSGLSTVVHPISFARADTEKTPHIYLAFAGLKSSRGSRAWKPRNPTASSRKKTTQEKNLVQVSISASLHTCIFSPVDGRNIQKPS